MSRRLVKSGAFQYTLQDQSVFICLYALGYLVLDSNLDLNFLSHRSRKEIQSTMRYTLSLKSNK